MLILRVTALAVALSLFAGGSGAQQRDWWDGRRVHMTREQLRALATRLNRAAQSPAYSAALRARTRAEAALVRKRLEEGDFPVGTRILVRVAGDSILSDTFTVGPGRVLTLPLVGEAPLHGVLGSELEANLARHVERFIREPVIQARLLIRVEVSGEVKQPGYYAVPSDALLTDVVMLAGGPSTEATLTRTRVERGDSRIWDAEPLQQAIRIGRTLDELDLRPGDRIVVPRKGRFNLLQLGGVLSALPGLVFIITAIF